MHHVQEHDTNHDHSYNNKHPRHSNRDIGDHGILTRQQIMDLTIKHVMPRKGRQSTPQPQSKAAHSSITIQYTSNINNISSKAGPRYCEPGGRMRGPRDADASGYFTKR